MRISKFWLFIIVSAFLFTGTSGAQADQTQTKLDGNSNLEFDVVDPSTATKQVFKMGKDGSIVLPEVTPDSTYPQCAQYGAIRLNKTTKKFEGCLYAGSNLFWRELDGASPLQALKDAEGVSGAPDYVYCINGTSKIVFSLVVVGRQNVAGVCSGGPTDCYLSYSTAATSGHEAQDIVYDKYGNYQAYYSKGATSGTDGILQSATCIGINSSRSKLYMDGRPMDGP